MYELSYMNACRDCGYSHESNDLNELRTELDELRSEDSSMAKYIEGYWAYIELWDESNELIERHELVDKNWIMYN